MKILLERRCNHFPIKTCWYYGCPEEACGKVAYPYGYKDKLTNWAYFCSKHWEELRKLQRALKNFYNQIERYDECTCCSPNKEKLTELRIALDLFRTNLINSVEINQTVIKYL